MPVVMLGKPLVENFNTLRTRFGLSGCDIIKENNEGGTIMGIRGAVVNSTYGHKEMELRSKSKLLDFVRRKLMEQIDEIISELEDYDKYIDQQLISTWFFKDVHDMDIPSLYHEWIIFVEQFGTKIKRSRDRYEISCVDFEDMDLTEDKIISLIGDLEDLMGENISLEVR